MQHTHAPSSVAGYKEVTPDMRDTVKKEITSGNTSDMTGEHVHTGDPMIEAFEDAEWVSAFDFDVGVFNMAASNNSLFWSYEEEEEEGEEESLEPEAA